LGVSSYFLVVFYNNWKSLFGGNLTFMSNRFGDFGGMLLYFFFVENGFKKLSSCHDVSSYFFKNIYDNFF